MATTKAPAPGMLRSPAFRRVDWGERVSAWSKAPIAALFMLYTLVPLYIMVKISVSGPEDILTQRPPFWIYHFTVENWREVLTAGGILGPLRKSLVVATLTMIMAVAIASPAAYVISRFPRRVRYAVVMALFFTRMFPDVGIAVSIAVNFIRLNLLDTDVGLVFAHLIGILPFIAWILVGTFETIPRDLEKAAMVDGCNKVTALIHVVGPIALPGVAVSAIFAWLLSWNEFTYALYLCLSRNTLPIQTYYYVVRGGWFHAATYATILTIPVFIVTYFLQRYLRTGYLSGAIKG